MDDLESPSEAVPTSSQNPIMPPVQSSIVQRGGAKIPIYRRGYGVARAGAVNPRPLVWEDGRLRQIEAEPSTPAESQPSIEPFPGAVVGHGMFPPPTLSSPQRLSLVRSEDMSMKARGRIARSRGKVRGGISGLMSPSGSTTSSRPRTTKEDGPTGTLKVPEMDASLPEAREHFIQPMDASIPPFSLTSEEPLPSNSVLFPILENDQTPNASNAPPSSLKMKSGGDGVDDLDFEKLRSYRRFNGYTMFTLAMKKKYGVNNDDAGAQDQKSLNRRWQALWSTLPERDRQQWKLRAKRMVKAMEAAPEKTAAAEAKRAAELKRAEAQLARTETSKYNLIDIAAHFQVLSTFFAKAAQQLSEYRGPVPIEDVTSTLLDGLLTCLIPLTAIAGQLEPLNGALDKDTICKGLTSLAHICPNL
ncbi:hypothetical protein Aperf_G00000073751 [Anoplocephala perfoliata]